MHDESKRGYNAMANLKDTGGHTLVELIVGAAAAAVLAVTLGAMLFYGYLTWGRNSLAVDLHRDATLAMETLARSLRQASAEGVDLSQPSSIVVSNQGTGILCSFYQQGSNLVFNPAVNSGGTPFVLVQGRLSPAGFTHSNTTRGVTLYLNLEQGMEKMKVSGNIAFRN
ncbi:MAG: hypothetical protein WCL44_06300 [bacterium]